MKMKIIVIAAAAVSAVLVFVLGFGFLDSSAEQTHQEDIVKTEEQDEHSCCSSEDAAEFTESSIYQLETEWVDQNSKEFSMSTLKGRPVVLTMFFASCTYACPILVNDMKKIEADMSEEERNSYRFVLVSIDPERDTPDALKKFAGMKDLDLKRWTLLTGTPDDVMELAALTGLKYRKEADGQFSHSNMIMILNEEGEIVHQHVGLNQDLTAALSVIKSL